MVGSCCILLPMRPQEKMIVVGICGFGFKMPLLWDSTEGMGY